MFEGSLLGDGGARNEAVAGLGARFFAGEKCCWRVEKAGREVGATSAFRFEWE
jgi:hypothetical protein